jgi:hypothetical protein
MARRAILARASLLATTSLVAVAGPAFSQTVGKTAAVNPAATSSTGRMLTLGAEIVHKERLRTDNDGSAQILFIDRTTLNIGPNSDVLIDEFVFDPNRSTGKMVVSLAKGLMRFVGGQISHSGNAQVKTPTASIGIRGAVGTFSYNPRTKITTAANDCQLCEIVVRAKGQEKVIQPGQTAVVGPDGTIEVRPTSQQDTDRNLKSTRSKAGQNGGARGKTLQQAADRGSELASNIPPGPGANQKSFFVNNVFVKDLSQTLHTTVGNSAVPCTPPPGYTC